MVASTAALTAYNNLFGLHPWHNRWYAQVNACASATALSAAAAGGLTMTDLGLGPRDLFPGRTGAGLATAVAASWFLIAVVPATRPVLGDKRVEGIDGREAAYQAIVRIPVGTVLWEEIAFRGVLQAALRRVMPKTAAITASSVIFGLWHVRPTIQALDVNGLTTNRRRAITRTLAGVTATAAGGALLSWLREHSGTLTAPILLHLTTNSGAVLAAWAVGNHASPTPPEPT